MLSPIVKPVTFRPATGTAPPANNAPIASPRPKFAWFQRKVPRQLPQPSPVPKTPIPVLYKGIATPAVESEGLSLIGRAVLQHVSQRAIGGGATNRTGEMSTSAATAQHLLQVLVSRMWASSTSQQRQLLWARLARWAHSNCLPINPDTACLFVLATGVSPQAQLAYTKALSGAFRHIGITNVPLLSLASALRATGAAIPVNQAPPVPKE
ncbi:hypothetical protein DIPPA_32445 [Diplonema papillatum]|nr:hypothetical protein DIPPA_32445 [Diplonema papillatum]